MTWFRRTPRPVPPLISAADALALIAAGHRVEMVTALVDPRHLPAFNRGIGGGR